MAKLQTMTGQVTSVPQPNYIFEVVYEGTADDKFQEKKLGHDLIYAFHGSRTENFHSILHCGLQGHMNKVNTRLDNTGVYCSVINLLWSLMSKRVRRFDPSATDLVHVLVSLTCFASHFGRII